MTADVVLVGGGLANALIAWRLAERRPDLELLMLEAGAALGGNHVWSFHGSDLTADQHEWVAPLVEKWWPVQEVRFPGHARTLETSYHSVTSQRLDQALRRRLGARVLVETEVTEAAATEVLTGQGRRICAKTVIDGRGLDSSAAFAVAWQKFVGLHVELEQPVKMDGPVLMDATVEQLDGYRFVYTLPFSDRRLLIEDTYYSDTPDLDRSDVKRRVLRYAEEQGWRVARVVAEEDGVLPIVLAGDIEAFWAERRTGVPCSGMRAALFHPTTGYSLPEAVRLADEVADLAQLDSASLDRVVRRRSLRAWKRGGFFRLLNRMLFQAAEPHLRYRVLERFYRLPKPLIERFYAGRPSFLDRARVLTGKPPVPLARAFACLAPGSARRVNLKRENERRKTA